MNTNTTTAFPRILTDAGIGLSHSTTTGEPVLNEAGFVLVFNQSQTLASNEAGETLNVAFARLIAYVQSLGY